MFDSSPVLRPRSGVSVIREDASALFPKSQMSKLILSASFTREYKKGNSKYKVKVVVYSIRFCVQG